MLFQSVWKKFATLPEMQSETGHGLYLIWSGHGVQMIISGQKGSLRDRYLSCLHLIHNRHGR